MSESKQKKTAAEEIQAAIDTLAELRSESSIGPWEGWKQYNPLRGTLYGIEAHGDEVAKTYSFSDTHLIEVLHRTIDVLPAILTDALSDVKRWVDPDSEFGWEESDSPVPHSRTFTNKLALARAINGATK